MNVTLSEADPLKAEPKPDGWHPLPKWADEPVFDGLFIGGDLAGTVRFAEGRWHASARLVNIGFDTQTAAVAWCERKSGYRKPTAAELEADGTLDAALEKDGWRRWADRSAGSPYDHDRVWWLSVDFKKPSIAHISWLDEMLDHGDSDPWFWKSIGEPSAAHIAAGADSIRAGQVWGDERGVNWRVRSVDRDGPDASAVLEPANLTEPTPDERVRADTIAGRYTLLSDAWAALATRTEI